MSNLEKNVCFWTKGDLLDLAFEYGLLESENDANNFSYALSQQELCEFVAFLFCGGWGYSRNFSVLDEETQKDDRVKRLFEYCDQHDQERE